MFKITLKICLLLFLQIHLQAHSQCVGGTTSATLSTIPTGSGTTISVTVPSGTIQWQQSSDGNNWTNVVSGTSNITNNPSSTQTTSFSYTGAQQTFIVPLGVTSIKADGYGGAGGHGTTDFNGKGGYGGRLIADLATTPGEEIFIYVGGKGHNANVGPGTGQQADNLWIVDDGLGGFNGGGNAFSASGGGGGATDIRKGGNTLSDRIFVAGAGGGGGNQRRGSESGGNGGNGGGTIGASGVNGAGGGTGGAGGSQVAGGAASGDATAGTLAVGGAGSPTSRTGGGGGAGYYGGGGGGWASDKAGGGGGGGSSFSSGTNLIHTQGYTSADGNGALSFVYDIPPTITSTYTTSNLTATTYYRAEVTDGSCVAYSSSTMIKVLIPATLSNFNAQTKSFFDGSFTISPPASNNSTGAFIYTSSNPSVATISGTTVTLVGIGTTTIQATQAANEDYIETSISADLTINSIEVVTKNGQSSNMNGNYVNKYGTIGSGSGITKNGESKYTKNLLTVGDNYNGGIIGYILQSGDPGYDSNVQHGLIVASSDQSSNTNLGTYGSGIQYVTPIDIGSGKSNTDIVAPNVSGGGIFICDQLNLNGYTDWFLPSKNELLKIYGNRVIIGGFNTSGNERYWTSSFDPSNSNFSYSVDFTTGVSDITIKTNDTNLSVRAVRSF